MLRTTRKTEVLTLAALILQLVAGQDRVSGQLIHHWTFDQGSGTSVEEFVSELPASLNNFAGDGSEWVPGVIGRALEFDGVDDYLTSYATLPRQQGTLAHWLAVYDEEPRIAHYESDSPDGEPTDYNGFGSAGDVLEHHSGAISGGWRYYYQDGITVGAGRFAVAGGAAVPGRWTHVAVTWDRSGDLVLYVDCVEVDRVTLAGGTFSDHGGNESFFGRSSEANRFWRGRMDEVRLYSHALSLEELRPFCRLRSESGTVEPGDRTESSFYFGTDVALTGDLMVLGEGGSSDGPAGRVHLFHRSPQHTWMRGDVIEGPPFSALNSYGHRLATDGARFAVVQLLNAAREVVVYSQQGEAWVPQVIDPPPGGHDASFGSDIALADGWLAISAEGNSSAPIGGAVYLYALNPLSGQFELAQTIADHSTSDDAFGASLDLDLPYLVVGAPNGDRAVVYEFDGSSFEHLLDRFGPIGSRAGASVAVSGTSVAIGRPHEDFGLYLRFSGTVEMVELLSGGSSTTQLLAAPNPTSYGNFGRRVALAGDDNLVVGLTDSLSIAGGAHLYRRTGDWRFVEQLRPENWQVPWERFGFAVAMGESEAVVTALFHDSGGNPGKGIAYLYDLPIFFDGFETGDQAKWSPSAR